MDGKNSKKLGLSQISCSMDLKSNGLIPHKKMNLPKNNHFEKALLEVCDLLRTFQIKKEYCLC